MRDYNEETAFLRRMLSYDEGFESKETAQRIAQAQREHACVLRAAWTMGLLALLAWVLSQADLFQSGTTIGLRLVCIAGLAALICFVSFVGLLLIYRTRLNRLRDKCRGLIGRLLENQETRRVDLLALPASEPGLQSEVVQRQEPAAG
jgi:hypothetical protein